MTESLLSLFNLRDVLEEPQGAERAVRYDVGELKLKRRVRKTLLRALRTHAHGSPLAC